MKLEREFFLSDDVIGISKKLIGKVLCTNIKGKMTSGIITETEAYAGVTDKASHAYGNRRTARTETMYTKGGVAYVYLCYGIHHLFNIVTNRQDIPHAVLVRGIHPLEGMEEIIKRRSVKKVDKTLCSGPGKVSQAMGIRTLHDGMDLTNSTIWLEDRSIQIKPEKITITPRIGVDYAEEDAELPYRFLYKGNLGQ